MRNKILLLAILIILAILVCCITPCIVADNSTNNISDRLAEMPFYNAANHEHHPLQFNHKILRDDFNHTKIISEQHLTPDHKLKKLSVSEKGESKSNYSFNLHGNVNLLWSYVNDDRDAKVEFDTLDDVNGDGIDDILVSDCNTENKLLVINGKDGYVIWSKNYSYRIGWPIDALNDDVNGDGIEDIIINREENGLIVELVSGRDGAEIWRKNVGGYDSAHAIYRDLNEDGIEDVLLEGSKWYYPTARHEICALSANDGSKLWNKTFEGDVHGLCYCFEDITGDRVYDFTISAYNSSTNFGELFAIRGSDGYVEWHKSFIGDAGWVHPRYDFDGDGLPDLDIEIRDSNNKTTNKLVLKGTDGSVIWSKLYNFRASEFGLDDINADGTTDLCLELKNFTTHLVTAVQVLSGRDGSVIWNREVNASDVGSCGDLNKDGKDDILLVNSTKIAENKYLYEVIAIGSTDESEIWKKSFIQIVEFKIAEGAYEWTSAWADGTSDLNGDEFEDISLETRYHYHYWDPNTSTNYEYYANKLVFINGKDSVELWNIEYTIDEPSPSGYRYTCDNFNNDGINDVLLRTKKGVYLLATMETPINQPPNASFTYSPSNLIINQTLIFNASSSYDPDGNIINYKWNFGDGNITNTTEKILTHSYFLAGDYTMDLTVTDNEGASDSISKTVSVSLGELLDVTFFSQREPAWCDKKLDHSSYSLGEYGCALTSAAMVSKYFGYDTDPERLNTSLTEVGGLDALGILYWEKVEEVSGGKVEWIGWVEGNWSKIDQELSRENPVIADVSCSLGNHFIVFIGKIGTDYYFLDPYDENRTANKWPNGAHGEYTLNNLRIYHRGRQQLVEAVEELELAIIDSIDYDIRHVADSYALLATAAELTPWWRELARLAVDTIHAVVGTAIEVGEFLTPKGANQVLEDPSTCQQVINGVKDSKDILGGIAAFQGLAGLYRNADSYKLSFEAINTIEEVARQEYEVSEDFDKTANAAWLELWRPSTPNGLLIPLKIGAPLKEGSRSSVSRWVNGLKEVNVEVRNSFDDVINEIPDPLPADYPLAETITYLKNLKQQIRGGGYRVVKFKCVEDDKEIKRHITLGMVQDGREATSLLYTAWMDDLDVQYTSTLYNTGETIMHVTAYGIPATGVTKEVMKGVSDLYEVIDIIQLPSDLVKLIDKPVHPLDVLQNHTVKMNNDLVHETSNLWALSEGTLKYLQYTWTP